MVVREDKITDFGKFSIDPLKKNIRKKTNRRNGKLLGPLMTRTHLFGIRKPNMSSIK